MAKNIECLGRPGVSDFGPGWCEVRGLFSTSRPGVCIHMETPVPLNAHQCRLLANYLLNAADWLDGYNAAASIPDGIVVYAISDGHSHHKIGKAVNFEKRLKQLQTGNGRRLRLVAYLQCNTEHLAYVAESAAKRSLADCRAVGEWFECNSHFALQALEEAAIECGIEYGAVSVCVGHEDEEAADGTHPQS